MNVFDRQFSIIVNVCWMYSEIYSDSLSSRSRSSFASRFSRNSSFLNSRLIFRSSSSKASCCRWCSRAAWSRIFCDATRRSCWLYIYSEYIRNIFRIDYLRWSGWFCVLSRLTRGSTRSSSFASRCWAWVKTSSYLWRIIIVIFFFVRLARSSSRNYRIY
jgi:hypothetical protein